MTTQTGSAEVGLVDAALKHMLTELENSNIFGMIKPGNMLEISSGKLTLIEHGKRSDLELKNITAINAIQKLLLVPELTFTIEVTYKERSITMIKKNKETIMILNTSKITESSPMPMVNSSMAKQAEQAKQGGRVRTKSKKTKRSKSKKAKRSKSKK